MMRKKTSIFVLFFAAAFCATVAQAAEKDVKKALDTLVDDARRSSKTLCSQSVTKASQDYCSRFVGYDLLPCLPPKVLFESLKQQGANYVVRARLETTTDAAYYVRLAFVKDGSRFKLDIPESLRIGLGKDWANRAHVMEQVYLIMRSQFGGKLGCDQLEEMVNTEL